VDAAAPAELIYPNRHRPAGLHTWADRIGDDEIQVIDEMRVTNAARTALDIASRQPPDRAVPAIDALARATRLETAGESHAGARRRRRGIAP
jgi:hypothetical protein